MKQLISDVLESVLHGNTLEFTSSIELSHAAGADLWDLFAAAGRVRRHFRGETVDICSIVNAKSGACSEDCRYCAQSEQHATAAPVYPLISLERIVEAAASAKKNGAKRFCIVTSGRGIDSPDELDLIALGVRRVSEIGLSPCATLGTLTKDQLFFLKAAGLHRYHHNIETSREYFPRICTTHTFDERLNVLRNAADVGLSTCSGGILGMGETLEDRVRMAFTLRDLDVDSLPINFLMPIPGTPLENISALRPLEALQAIALFRLILPEKEIRVCAGRGTALGQLHPLIFMAGADGFMTGNYLTTSGMDPKKDLDMIKDLELSL